MGDLKRGAKKAWGGLYEGSKQIADKLGFSGAGISPPSDKAKRQLAAANAPPPVIPIPDEEALRQDRRRRIAGQSGSGRASTVLTSQDDLLG